MQVTWVTEIASASAALTPHPSRVEIDLDALTRNVRVLREAVGVAVTAVVKAGAYGHGAEAVAEAALAGGASGLAVSTPGEGIALRRAGVDAPILVMGWTPAEIMPEAVAHDLRLAAVEPGDFAAAARAAADAGRPARLHVKIDSGMGRLGFPAWDPATPARILAEARRPGIEIEGIFTHLACAGQPGDTYTAHQLSLFRQVLAELASGGLRPPLVHAANSAGALHWPEARFNMVRVGIAMYGLGGEPEAVRALGLEPVLRWVTRVAQVKTLAPGVGISYGRTFVPDRPMRVAVLPVGYADGFDRRLSNRGQVLIGGRRVRVLGAVCMDQIIVGEVDESVRRGDEAVLIGRQGREEVSAAEMAALLDTIPYEVVTRIGPRVVRVYRRGVPGPGDGAGAETTARRAGGRRDGWTGPEAGR